MQSNCNNDKTRKFRNRLLGKKIKSTDELSRKVLGEVQPRDDRHGQRRRSQPPLPEPNTGLRKSLAWDSAFLTSPGAFDLEELMKTLNLHDVEKVNNSSRPSLAWDCNFFTSEGVLDAEELSKIHNGLPKTSTAVLPRIENDLWTSNKRKSVDKENLALWNLENDLFKDGNAYAFRSMDSTGSIPKLQEWTTGQSREATSNLDFPSKNMMQPMLSLTRKPVTTENSEQSLKEIFHRPPRQARHTAKEEECMLSLVPKRLRRNSLLNFLSRKHDGAAINSSDDCTGIYTKIGIVNTSISDTIRGRASSIHPNLNASIPRLKSPLRCSREKTSRVENPSCSSKYYVFTCPVSLTEKYSWNPSFSMSTSRKNDISEPSDRDSTSEMQKDSLQEHAFAVAESPMASTDVRNKNEPSRLRLPSPKIRLSNEKVPVIPSENRTPICPSGRENNASKIPNRNCNLNNLAEKARTPTKTLTGRGDTKLLSVKSGALRSPLVTRSAHPHKVQNSSSTGSRKPLKSTIHNAKDGQIGLRASKRSRNEHGKAGTQYAGNLTATTPDDDKENLAFVESDYNLGNTTDLERNCIV